MGRKAFNIARTRRATQWFPASVAGNEVERLCRIVRRRTWLSHASSWSSTFRAPVKASAPAVEGNRQKNQLQIPGPYLTFRTCRRWARHEQLPVQKLNHVTRSSQSTTETYGQRAKSRRWSSDPLIFEEGLRRERVELSGAAGADSFRRANIGEDPTVSNQREKDWSPLGWHRADLRPRRSASRPD